MDVLKVLGCLIFLFGFVFGNQPGQYLFLKEQSVFIHDWRNEILIPNGIVLSSYYSLTNTEISNIQANDSIQMQKTPSDASRVTFGKIMLESLGAASGGILTGLAFSMIVGDKEFWQGAAAFTGIIIGLAGGTTLVGNTVMEPNGSFIKSLIGASIGTSLGTGILWGAMLLAFWGWEPGMEEDWKQVTLAYCGLSLGVLLPISGAVIGYNSNGFGCCLTSTNNSTNDSVNQAHCFVKPTYAIQIVKIGF